jgi:uncharacterized protein (DUF2062 family)
MPDPNKIREHKYLRVFGTLLHDPNLWHLNRRSASGAFGVGLFMAWVPVPFQMVLAAAAAIIIRVNLPVAVGLVWVSNPFTMPPLFYFAYKLGSWLLGEKLTPVEFELSVEWVMYELGEIWEPFLLGCLICGIVSSGLGFGLIRLLWRMHLVRYIKNKRARGKK